MFKITVISSTAYFIVLLTTPAEVDPLSDCNP